MTGGEDNAQMDFFSSLIVLPVSFSYLHGGAFNAIFHILHP